MKQKSRKQKIMEYRNIQALSVNTLILRRHYFETKIDKYHVPRNFK